MPTYHIIDFLKNFEIRIEPNIQERELFPFTMQCAKRFFNNFTEESFTINEEVRSIIITDGKENLPRHSYVSGSLYSLTCEEIEGLDLDKRKPVGFINLEYGGNRTKPYVRIWEK